MFNEPDFKKFIDYFIDINPNAFDVLFSFEDKEFEVQVTDKEGNLLPDNDYDFDHIFEVFTEIVNHDSRSNFARGSCGSVQINLKTRVVKVHIINCVMKRIEVMKKIEIDKGENNYIIGEDGKIGEDADLV